MKLVKAATTFFTGPGLALVFFAGCSSGSSGGETPAGTCANGTCKDGGQGGGGEGGGGVHEDGGDGSEAGFGVDTGGGGGSEGGVETGSAGDGGIDPGGDADMSYDAIGNANVVWGQPCLYNFGSSCPFSNPQECGNHQGVVVTFPNGPQLLNATLFDGLDCSPNALNDNFNDQQNTMGTGIWMFTDDADVAGVSPSNPTSAVWWVGPLTASGYPPAGAPTTGCINYTSAMAMCQ